MGIFKAYFSIMSSKFDIGHDTLVNIGTFNVHELLWMLQRNRTNNDESTFFNLNIDCFFCVKLGIAVHKWKRETLSRVDPHAIYSLSSVFPWYIWNKLNKLLKYNKYQLTKRWLPGKLEGYLGVS